MTATVAVEWRGKSVGIEFAWFGELRANGLPLVFLHEGLGSLAMWRGFPERVAATCDTAVLAYSRPGYGASTPRRPEDAWSPDFMHRQALEVLPTLLDALGIDGRYALVGHSDGGSIALLHAALRPDRVAAVVALAPHLFVEPITLAGIREARETYLHGDLRSNLARYHADADSAFWGWNDIWLAPAFAGWNIEGEVAKIVAPVLAIQGVDDQYGTLRQIRRIRELLLDTRLLELPACRHSPQRDRPEAVVAAIRDFMTHHSRRSA